MIQMRAFCNTHSDFHMEKTANMLKHNYKNLISQFKFLKLFQILWQISVWIRTFDSGLFSIILSFCQYFTLDNILFLFGVSWCSVSCSLVQENNFNLIFYILQILHFLYPQVNILYFNIIKIYSLIIAYFITGSLI